MSKATDTEIKDLILSLDKKFNALDHKIDLLTQKVDGIGETVKKLDNRLWAFGGLILAACVGAFLKALDL
jgi:hypothetical protein